MGWRGVRRDIINAVKRSATASRKANARAERARFKAVRAAPQQAHYPQAQGYGPPPGQAYGPAPQGYAPQGYGPTPAPKSGLSAGLMAVVAIGAMFFCGTCSAVIAGVSGSSMRQASAPTRSDGRPPGAMDPVVGPDAPPLPAYVPPASTAPARAGAKPAAARPVVPTPARRVPAAQPAPGPPAGPRCCDGSTARCTGRGCCSHHGGVCSR